MVSTDGHGVTTDVTTDVTGVTSVGDTSATGLGPTGEPASTGSTAPKFDLGSPMCEIEPGGSCDADEEWVCPETETCRPYDVDGGGTVSGAHCFPQGEVPEQEACEPACSSDPELVCSGCLTCDQFSSVDDENGLCHPLCAGDIAALRCSDGLYFQCDTADRGGFGICRGDCNPTGKEPRCETGQACVMRQDAPTPTCAPTPAAGMSADCSMSECMEGLICMAQGEPPGCEASWYCAPICGPPQPCPGGGVCNALPDLEGATLDIGFCDL